LEDLFRDQTAVGGQAIMYRFSGFPIFFLKKGYRLFYQVEAEEWLSAIEVEIVAVSQER